MPQVPKLLQPRLSGLFDDNAINSDVFDYNVPPVPVVDPNMYVSDPVFDNYETIFVDDNGDTVDVNGNVLISADDVKQVVAQNPGAEAESVARVLKAASPDWASQFRTTDELIKAAAGLLTTVKAVVSGKPIPQYPGGAVPTTKPAQKPGNFSIGSIVPGSVSPALLIGGAAAAYFLLRRK